jgi:hypothetical protein
MSLVVLGGGGPPSVAILAGLDAAAAVFLVWVWSTVAFRSLRRLRFRGTDRAINCGNEETLPADRHSEL